MLNPLSIRVVLLASLLLAGSAPAILSQATVIRDITWERGQPLRNPIKYNAYGVIGDRIITACGTQVPGVGGEHWNKRAWLFDPVLSTIAASAERQRKRVQLQNSKGNG